MVENDPQYELVYQTLHHYWTTRTGSEDDSHDIALEAIFDEQSANFEKIDGYRIQINNNLTCWSWENNNLKAASLSLRSSVLTTAIQDGLNIARLFNLQIIQTN